jgi:acetyl esterase/lipase
MNQHMPSHVIDVWPGEVPDNDLWRDIGPELERLREGGDRLVRNVSRPTMTASLPDPEMATGTGVIVCPGGAFHFLSIDKEGTEVARWLTARGIAAFVLKYRLVPTPDDEAFQAIAANPTPHRPMMDRVRPMVVDDGLQAMRTVREQATRWGIAPDRLGILGFSAGAHAAVGAAMKYLDAESRPDFAASVYGEWWERWIPADAPPLFLTAAMNDPLIDVSSNTSLYEAWYAAGRPVELHLYSQGGHGFGLVPQGLPSDGWIDRFREWLRTEGFFPHKETSR